MDILLCLRIFKLFQGPFSGPSKLNQPKFVTSKAHDGINSVVLELDSL